MSLTVAEEALRADADLWDGVARTTELARQSAAELTLAADALSWAAAETPLQATYDEVQRKIGRLLSEATTVFTGLSTALDQVATAYKAGDVAAAVRFKGVWDPRD
jgi:hypothetical protein